MIVAFTPAHEELVFIDLQFAQRSLEGAREKDVHRPRQIIIISFCLSFHRLHNLRNDNNTFSISKSHHFGAAHVFHIFLVYLWKRSFSPRLDSLFSLCGLFNIIAFAQLIKGEMCNKWTWEFLCDCCDAFRSLWKIGLFLRKINQSDMFCSVRWLWTVSWLSSFYDVEGKRRN